MAVKVKLTNVTLAFPNLFEKSKFGNYGATFIMEPGHANIDVVKRAIKQVAEEDMKGKIPSPSNLCMRSNEEKASYDGFVDGGYYVAANRKEGFAPNQLIKRDKTSADEDTFYPGCKVNAVVNLWAQDNQWGRKINAELVGVQFAAHGERLGRGATKIDDDDFDTLPELEEEGADSFF